MRGNRSLLAKERFPRAPSEKADWEEKGNKKSDCFSADVFKRERLVPLLSAEKQADFFLLNLSIQLSWKGSGETIL